MTRIQQQSHLADKAANQPANASAKPADAMQPRPEKPERKNLSRGIGQSKKGKLRYKCAVCLFRVGIGIKTTAKQLRISPKKAIQIRNDAGIKPLKWRMQPGCKPKKGERAKLYEEKKWPIYRYVPTEAQKQQRHEEHKRKARERYYANHEENKRISRENARQRYNSLTSEQKREAMKKKREWLKANPDKARAYRKKSSQTPAAKAARRRLQRKYRKQPKYKVTNNLRARLRELVKTRSVRSSSLTGCTGDFLVKHLESQFTKAMTWENYGTYWHVDHILPCAAFDLTDDQEVKQCFNWQNLQPLEAMENVMKSNTITEPQQHMALSFSE